MQDMLPFVLHEIRETNDLPEDLERRESVVGRLIRNLGITTKNLHLLNDITATQGRARETAAKQLRLFSCSALREAALAEGATEISEPLWRRFFTGVEGERGDPAAERERPLRVGRLTGEALEGLGRALILTPLEDDELWARVFFETAVLGALALYWLRELRELYGDLGE